MNVIYIKKSDKEVLINRIKQYLFDRRYSYEISNDVIKLLFIKQNKKIINVLEDWFPKVLISIITDYYYYQYIKVYIHFTKSAIDSDKFYYDFQYNLHIN